MNTFCFFYNNIFIFVTVLISEIHAVNLYTLLNVSCSVSLFSPNYLKGKYELLKAVNFVFNLMYCKTFIVKIL